MASSPALGLARRSPSGQRPATRNSPEAAPLRGQKGSRAAGHFGRAPGAMGVSCAVARPVLAATVSRDQQCRDVLSGPSHLLARVELRGPGR